MMGYGSQRGRLDNRKAHQAMSFWDIIWFIVVTFAFVALLMIMFTIIGDLIRDKTTSGLAKAIWFIALILFPWITAFIYLIVRGSSMAERRAQDVTELQKAQEAYIRSIAGGGSSAADQIQQAKALLDSGAINQQEYDALKAKALA